jgi:hypothetical protein
MPVVLLLVASHATQGGGLSRSAPRGETPSMPPPAVPLARIDFSGETVSTFAGQTIAKALRLKFQEKGESLCAWWLTGEGPFSWDGGPIEFRVFNLKGRLLYTFNETNFSRLLHDFPDLGWRCTQRPFVSEALAWCFSPDYAWGLRAENTNDWTVRLERWDLPVTGMGKRVWQTIWADTSAVSFLGPVAQGKDEILAAVDGHLGVLFSPGDGQVLRRFPLGHRETLQESKARAKKFGLREGTETHFYATHFAYDQASRLLACGCYRDKRVRIVNTMVPEKVVFEANTDSNPERPRGGQWSTRRVEFAGSGSFLIVDYEYQARNREMQHTEIFETKSWKIVWNKESLNLGAVTISPDGKLMAYVKDKFIEIAPFLPNRPPENPK